MGECVRETFLSVTGETVGKRLWLPEGKPRAVLQLLHGMAEHIDRYDATAKAMNKAGFAVVGHNHLGHGQEAKTLGHFARQHGWDALIEDTHALRQKPSFLSGDSLLSAGAQHGQLCGAGLRAEIRERPQRVDSLRHRAF